MTDETCVAVLGAGSTMGLGMARNIARAGIRVRAWNRTVEKARPVQDDGAEVFDTAKEAADGADVIMTMLADADAVIGTLEDAAPSAAGGAVWLQMSTIGEAGTDRCAEVAEKHGLTLIDAPVLGTKQPAEDGKLVVLASGPEQARKRVEPIFDAVGQKTIWVGETGAGTRMKMVANSWVLTVVEGVAETFALAEGLDLDPSLLLDAIEGGTLDLPYLRMKGQTIMERNFEPSFRLKLAAKDARLIEESAARHGVDVPLFSTIRRRLAEGAKEHGDEDFSATYWTSAPARSGA
ncbi:MAG: NAD(P)-dependent oxidoreductase [Solirubrobacterales bacterium]|nr:NAD(P)-dependent oxidoreductase [Solirubrobacterales bacterium]